MAVFSHPNISLATPNDVAQITTLLNAAYRGEESKKGWTTEANIIAGDVRTSKAELLVLIAQPTSVLVKYTNEQGQIVGCVFLKKETNKMYLGMFSVSPKLQGGGIGKLILQAAEEYALHVKCTSIYMSVISVRSELINWYKRHGYTDTGERKPFEQDDKTGIHLQPLDFMMLEKKLV